MKKNEVIKILAVCKSAGVQFGDSDKKALVELWLDCFEDNTYAEVSKALKDLIKGKEPLFVNGLIGKIKEKILEDKLDLPEFAIVWELIRKAMHKTHPDIPEETVKAFRSLPPMIQYLVGSPRHLEDMEYCLTRDILETVEKSNMRKSYAELVTNTKNRLVLGKVPAWQQIENGNTKRINIQVGNILEGHRF